MRTLLRSGFMAFAIFSVISCSDNANDIPANNGTPNNPGTGNSNNSSWLIPSDQVFDGGPGKDGIPSIDNPQFVSVAEAEIFMEDEDLIIGLADETGQVVRAYPHRILDWHEIVNDDLGQRSTALTYCPLTGSAIGWDRSLENGTISTFGVSGLLYNTNLIPYDRATDSNWSQMQLQCVQGNLRGELIKLHPIVETSWKNWKTMYPDSEILSTETGFSRNYFSYPYGDYRTNNSRLFFPVANEDNRRPAKERVLGVVEEFEQMVFLFEEFSNGRRVIEQLLDGKKLIVSGSEEENFMLAFYNELSGGDGLVFSPIEEAGPNIMTDQEGNIYDVFGRVVSGPRLGQALSPARSYIAFFFSLGAFYPDIQLHIEL